jgi:hypothetical protein
MKEGNSKRKKIITLEKKGRRRKKEDMGQI